ncbi:fumarylacetoacetate hydrolase family protein [Paraburkholderia sp. J63]|uniref:fumarylacetoacetate hydrolase family protein n=1 Tax=Paraburkholderia sp. J63 TaxID=2805434 RepID=UPI002ABD5346|nr:fumarylacetoacetate hydrolase family protein [Paraburkholderia sp. J63]
MKLATCSKSGVRIVGVVDVDRDVVIDLQQLHQTLHGSRSAVLASMLDLIEAGERGLELVRSLVERSDPGDADYTFALASATLLAPLPRPTQLRDFSVFPAHLRGAPKGLAQVALAAEGANASFKAAGEGYPPIYDREPVFYFSNRMSVAGHGATVEWPPAVKFLDFELEMAVCIGRTGKNIAASLAAEHVFGYLIFNDVSARDAQARQVPAGLGPCKGKSYDGCNILGPWIVTRDELPDPYRLNVEVRVNGEVWTRSTTADMLHRFEDMIAFASAGETVHAGEVFGSGTVSGCCSLESGRWMKPGDVLELTIEGIGTLGNRFGTTS